MFIGDSLTWYVPWNELLGNKNVLNRGRSADTTAAILKRMDGVLSAQPKRAFLMMGMNDALEEKTTVDKTLSNYQNIIDLLKKNEISIVVVSTSPCNKVLNKKCVYGLPKIIEINARLKLLTKKYNIPYLDLYSLLSGKDGLEAKYAGDGIHFNLEGYKLWVSLVAPYVLS
ncbi:GDSL-type esterase/lipase family protein [Legionella sp. km772]|uniref:GDSL-type esterase/lipase family protein n=1 Tax=Legionella sp. km772 TaxID=2498111 RepID=UPI001315112B|nr:GDSL-type esterase/lipase family protein [Legionella sp. km772]